MVADASFSWDDLFEHIEDRQVIPFVGPELLDVTIEGQRTRLQDWTAAKLAARLRLPANGDDPPKSLNDVVCRFLRAGGQREDVYARLRGLLKDQTFEPPEALRQLAQIRHFQLYVTTTFDTLLEQALNRERGPGTTDVIAYSPNNAQDLPRAVDQLSRPTVFHLLGRLSASPDYVITEEDQLEFLCAIQQEAKRPKLLLDELKDYHLLLIGCNLPDWLARFLIRIAKGSRLSLQRSASEILADRLESRDRNLVLFLQSFSYRTRVFPDGDGTDFVRELWTRYRERHPETAAPQPAGAGRDAPLTDRFDMVSGAVFLSYASEDLPAARQVREALAAAGIEVWFDKVMLESGDAWNAKISRHIRNCSLFLPLVSPNTQRRLEGYFRLEWRWAADRSLQIADGIPFILPVQIGAAPLPEPMVPERFRAVQWTHLPDGQPSPEFVARIVKLYRDYRRREKGLQ